MNPRPKKATPLKDYKIEIEFSNNEVRVYDFRPHLNFGVFKELNDINYFNKVQVLNDTLTWPNEQDICPDTLYLDSVLIRQKFY